MSYKKFAFMLGVSFLIMYAVMFLNVERLGHVYYSHTRLYMTLLMLAPMALLKLLFMGDMYPSKMINRTIMGGSVGVFVIALFLLRSQTGVADKQYMQAMIPHHSSAIMTSEAAHFEHPEVQKLAKNIIEAQKKEIALMERLLQEVN